MVMSFVCYISSNLKSFETVVHILTAQIATLQYTTYADLYNVKGLGS